MSILYLVNEKTNFLNAFTHFLSRYGKQKIDAKKIFAVLMAWGTNTGLSLMGKISDINYDTLVTTSSNFFRIETLQEVNRIITDFISKLPIFELYNINKSIHSSSDGQKFETSINTTLSRNSKKYFGMKKGIVVYTLSSNHVPLYVKVIGANDHESHFVFDVLYNNPSKIVPTIHSTDTHGVNAVNHLLLFFNNYLFAPRYKNLKRKLNTSLSSFKPVGAYPQNYEIKPVQRADRNLIIAEGDNIQRLVLSLVTKSASQSELVKRLSAYSLNNQTAKALWELDNNYQQYIYAQIPKFSGTAIECQSIIE